MSAAVRLQAGVLAHLRSRALGLTLFDAPPVRAGMPYAIVGEPVLAAADAAGVTGRLGSIAITYADAGERPVRLRALVAAVEEAVSDLGADLGAGWRLTDMRLARSRIAVAAAGGGGRWIAQSDFAVRVFRVDS